MDESPKGREIKEVYGDASAIIARGKQIKSLGTKMISSAKMLEDLADGASGQKGLAVDKLQEVVGDSYKELKLAGERYKPTGPILITYGEALDDIKPLIKTAVTNCQTEWSNYIKKKNAYTKELWTADDPDKPDAEDDAEDDMDDAKADWKAEAITFDTHYDTWEDAFDKAAKEIGKATDGGISDGFWDNVDGIVDTILTVLAVVGLILAIACMIVGGPLLAVLTAIAAIVAIATLLLTIYAFARGDATGWDLAFAIVGVIPFGSMGKLFNGNKMSFVDDMFGGLLNTAGQRTAMFGDIGSFLSGFRPTTNGLSGLLAGLKSGASNIPGQLAGSLDSANILSKLMTGLDADDFADLATQSGAQQGINIISSVFGNGIENLGNVDQFVDLVNGGTGIMDMMMHDIEINDFINDLSLPSGSGGGGR